MRLEDDLMAQALATGQDIGAVLDIVFDDGSCGICTLDQGLVQLAASPERMLMIEAQGLAHRERKLIRRTSFRLVSDEKQSA